MEICSTQFWLLAVIVTKAVSFAQNYDPLEKIYIVSEITNESSSTCEDHQFKHRAKASATKIGAWTTQKDTPEVKLVFISGEKLMDQAAATFRTVDFCNRLSNG